MCELVGLFLLNLTNNESGKHNMGLHRDNDRSCCLNIYGPDSRKIKKNICKIFREFGLNRTLACNLVITYILNIIFDLKHAT